MSDEVASLVRGFGNRWMDRRGGTASSIQLSDVVGDGEIEFLDVTDPDEESGAYGTVTLMLSGRLLTFRVMEREVEVTHFGELWGGSYVENVRLDGEIVERELIFEHPRLPGEKLEYAYNTTGREEEKYAALRKRLREWSTALRAQTV
jgi:hypothetical protein